MKGRIVHYCNIIILITFHRRSTDQSFLKSDNEYEGFAYVYRLTFYSIPELMIAKNTNGRTGNKLFSPINIGIDPYYILRLGPNLKKDAVRCCIINLSILFG